MATDTGVGSGGAGVQLHKQDFWFGKNPGKFTWNPGKICGNLGKICENVRKIAVCALILQKLKFRRFFFI